jgi:DUF2939 family protein
MSRKPFLLATAGLAAAYLAYPYFTLYRLETALRHGDSARLAAMIDWEQVRDGLVDDICDRIDGGVSKPPTAASSTYALPPFGSSFMKGIAATAVESAVTPEGLTRMVSFRAVAADGHPTAARATSVAGSRVKWAFFDNPSTFSVWVRTPANAASDGPIKLRMELSRGGSWKITRVWLPPTLLARAGAAEAQLAGSGPPH